MNKYTFEDNCVPTLEYYLANYRKKKGVKIYMPGIYYTNIVRWGSKFFNSPQFVTEHQESHNSDIAIIDDEMSPYEILKLLCKAFDAVKKDGIIVCNHFFENKPHDEFEHNTRYGIDAFSFVVQYRTDIIYKGNQIIYKKL